MKRIEKIIYGKPAKYEYNLMKKLILMLLCAEKKTRVIRRKSKLGNAHILL